MASLHAYFDESGMHDGSTTAVVAGAVSERKDWDSFENRWIPILQRYGVSMFHANKCDNAQQEYKGWDENKRHEFRSELIKVIGENIRFGIYHIVDTSTFNETTLHLDRKKRLSQYEHCLVQCMASMIHKSVFDPGVKTITIYIEQGQKVRPGLRKMLASACKQGGERALGHVAKKPFQDLVYLSKDDNVQFQVADLIAYEVFRRHHDLKTRRSMFRRRTLVELFDSFPCIGQFSDSDYLKKTFEFIPDLWSK